MAIKMYVCYSAEEFAIDFSHLFMLLYITQGYSQMNFTLK